MPTSSRVNPSRASELPLHRRRPPSVQHPVLQLFYNQLTGSIPTRIGALKKLSVVDVQSNQLTGAIRASLGDLGMLVRARFEL